jgi:GT2 family glycosyltransferase
MYINTFYYIIKIMTFTKGDIITTDKYLYAFNDIYYKTDILYNNSPINWRNKVHNPPRKNMDIIITGHSDYDINDTCVDLYNPKIWYTVNKQTIRSNVYSLPLGITNNTDESPIHSIYGDLDSMITIMNDNKYERKNLVYMNFNINTYPQERQVVYNLFCDKIWVTIGETINSLEGRTNYLRDIKKHDFILCPRGNGIDTHRLWESLYMGSIPIVKRDIAFKDFEDLPICFVDDWSDINEEFLKAEKNRIKNTTYNLEKLKIGYWIDNIRSSIHVFNINNINNGMKLTTVLSATNNNPSYYRFIPKQILFWKYFNIKFIALFIGESIPDELEEYKENIILWDKPTNYILHSAYIAQNIRIYYPALLNLPDNEMVMITDMDMLPTNDKFYKDGLEQFTKKDFIYYKFIEGKQIFMCYNAAHSSTWSSIFNIKSEKDIERELINNYNIQYDGTPGLNAWYSDQELMYNTLINYPYLKVLNRQYKRLDIDILKGHIERGDKDFISLYDDIHFHRDYKSNENFILYIQNQLTCIEDMVSVIIPSFNRFKYLLNAIKSVKEQTYKNIEIIVVNDCSTQKEYYTFDFKTLGENVYIIHLPKHSKNILGKVSGGGHSRNIGMMLTSGKYIAFLDDDDYFLPTKIEKQISAMKINNCNISCTDAYAGNGTYNSSYNYKTWHYNGIYWNDLKTIFNNVGKPNILKRMYEKDINVWTLNDLNIHNCTCGGSSIIFLKNLIEKAHYFPVLTYGEDYSYWKKLFEYSNCVFIREPLTYIDLKHGDGQNYL